MERIERTIKMGLATLLVAMLLALGGITAANGNTGSAITTLFPAAQATSQDAVARNAVAVDSIATDTAQQTAATQQAQQGGVLDARYAVHQVGSAVVTIVNTMQITARGRFGSQSQTAEALGSGVIISGDGYIVTNQHVVEGQQSLEVIFADGTRVPATLVGEDAYTDVAVIKVDANMPAVAQFGDSDKLEPGQPVVAIGTALGDFENTVTAGIVSGLHRQLEDGGTSLQDLIQTDAAINHGNSGGALLDLDGNVVGINTAVVRNDGTMGSVAEGLGFAIPSNTVKAVVEQLIGKGAISHPYIGVSYQPITPELSAANNLPTQQGLYVTDVADGSPAAQAGIQPNSIITKLDGVAVGSDGNTNLVTLLSKYKVGDSVTLVVIVPGSSMESDVTIVLAARPTGQ
jgi:S1-C subfamily serine protease